MFLKNLFPPIPSELIMPLAGYSGGKGELNLAGVLAAGTLGTLLGTLFWYLVAKRLSEARLRRWAKRHGRWITLSEDDIVSIERWFCRHRRWAVPLAHVVPGLRTLISIPAGIFAMPLPRFVALTVLGAGLWNSALGTAGYMLGAKFDAVDRYLGPVSTTIMVALFAYYLARDSVQGELTGKLMTIAAARRR